jgi:hypothetical protein
MTERFKSDKKKIYMSRLGRSGRINMGKKGMAKKGKTCTQNCKPSLNFS